MQILTLTTDFGGRDWFVGTMKGVALRINPRVRLVDITHEIPPGDIRAGAFALMSACRYFPAGTVHLVVVDPGVGGQRRALAVETADSIFVGPDNGVLSWALAREKIKSVRLLENKRYCLKPVSRTFHGRDIFAPAAAHLSRGLSLDRLGREAKDFVRVPWPPPATRHGEIRGEIVYIDRFGNALTNIEAQWISGAGRFVCEARGKKKARCVFADFYGAVPAKCPVAVVGSSGFLEIAVNGGSAARRFGLRPGDPAIVRANLPPIRRG